MESRGGEGREEMEEEEEEEEVFTGQLRPRCHAADGVDGVCAQAVVQQLPVANPEPQQDPVDLLLGGRLPPGGGGGGRERHNVCSI